jgi:hypothetical protein
MPRFPGLALPAALIVTLWAPLPARAESLAQAQMLELAATGSFARQMTAEATLEGLVTNGHRRGYGTSRTIWMFSNLDDLVPLIDGLSQGDAGRRTVALTLTARIIWTAGQPESARAMFLQALDTATGAGIGDREIGFLLADLAVLDFALGDTAGAAVWRARTERCGEIPCPFDLLEQLAASPPDDLTDPPRPEVDQRVDRFLSTHLPGQRDTYWGRHLVAMSYRIEDSFPIEAADYAERGYYVTERQNDALHAMWLALKVNRFARVQDIAAHLAERVDEATIAPRDRLYFRRLLARAQLRAGDRMASADYTVIADLAVAVLAGDAQAEGFDRSLAEANKLMLDVMDSTNINAGLRLVDALLVHENSVENWSRRARLLHRAGDSAAAAAIMRDLRGLDWITDWSRRVYLVQEAAYARAAGDAAVADALLSTLPPADFTVPDTGAPLPTEGFSIWPSGITAAMDQRDAGNHEGAAYAMAGELQYVPTLAERGSYSDAQILWQVAYTLARGGQPAEAFPIMTRAAAIAASLSFADPTGVDGGTLQLLQRDNIRYLLFIDIAWAAARGVTPEEMMVFSRY